MAKLRATPCDRRHCRVVGWERVAGEGGGWGHGMQWQHVVALPSLAAPRSDPRNTVTGV